MLSKKEVHQACVQQLQERINRLAQEFQALQQAYGEETKSSAGDKYETSREMIQAERQKLGTSLADAQKQMQLLQSLDPVRVSETVQAGSLVETMSGWYYVSASLGQIPDFDTTVFAISPVSPLAQQLLGKGAGDAFTSSLGEQRILSLY